jgi:MFS family permease
VKLIQYFVTTTEIEDSNSRSTINVVRLLFFLFFAAFGIFVPYINVYYRAIGLSGIQIGLINTLSPLVGIFSGPLWGMISDRFGISRRILMATLTGVILAVIGISAVRVFIWILPLAAAYSLFNNAFMPLLDSIGLHFLGKYRQQYGRLRIWGSIGFIISTSIIGYILEQLGLHSLFYGYTVLMLLVLVVLIWLPAVKPRISTSVWRGLSKLICNPTWLVFSASLVLLGLANSGMYIFLGIYITELGGNEVLIGTAMSLGAITELPFMLFSAPLIMRFGSHRTLALAYFFYAVRLFLYGIMPSAWWALPISLLHGITFGIYWVSAVSYANDLALENLKATAQGMLVATLNLAAVLGGVVSGLLYDHFGLAFLFRLYSGFTIVALVLLGVRRRV